MKRTLVLVFAALAFPLLLGADGPRLFSSIRAGDTAAVQRLLASGTSASAKDESGATALMWRPAAASGRRGTVRPDRPGRSGTLRLHAALATL